LKIYVPQKKDNICIAKTSLILFGFWTYQKSGKRFQKEEPGHFDRLDQLLFEIGNEFSLNGVRAQLISNYMDNM